MAMEKKHQDLLPILIRLGKITILMSIDNEVAKSELSKILIMAPSRYFSSNWLQCEIDYSYNDKMFLNEKFSKYGHLNFDAMMKFIYRLNYQKLLPELLSSINDSIKIVDKAKYYSRNTDEITKLLKIYSCYSFLNYEEKIKSDNDLIVAFENILEYQIGQGSEVSAVLLDEFRIH